MSEPVLRVDAVTHRLGQRAERPVLQDVTARVCEAEVVALAGRSGSGKSTLCHLVAGLGSPTSGTVTVDGTPADRVQNWAAVSLLPQRLALVEEMTVEENVRLPLRLHPDRSERPDPEQLLETLDLLALAGRRAMATSLGEQQRTALARALVLRPRLAVLDEPTGHQDDDHVDLVLAALDWARRHGTAVLVATHDDRVLDVADRVVGLHLGRVLT